MYITALAEELSTHPAYDGDVMRLQHVRSGALVVSLLAMTSVVDARVAPSRAPQRTPPPTPSQTPQPQGAACAATLTVRQTEGAAGCFLDERVTGAPGVLRYPCGGGPATASFRNGTFQGRVEADGAVSLSLATSFHYSDRCDWTSAQTITGSLSTRRLTFQYTEAPVAGQRGCAGACRATGSVAVRATQ